ncbi:hypothetical protein NMG60_11007996 [Bertholletia excelsa]
MDRGKKPSKFLTNRNNKIYMDLKDIIKEHALPFLPAKSLLRFQGVSPSFISIDPSSCGVPDPSLKFLPEPVDIKASANGLLCCQGIKYKAYYICNPVTKQWKELPKSNADHGPNPSIVLVFEPSLLNFVADYKVVCAFPSTDFDNATEFEIYSSTDGSWRVSGEICFATSKLVHSLGAYADGIVYWQARPHGIVAFDLNKDRSQLLQGCYGNNAILGTWNGRLCSTYINGLSITVRVLSNVYSNTMQMNSNAKTWREISRFFLNNLVLGGVANEPGLMLFSGENVMLVQIGKTIIYTDMKGKETKILHSNAEYEMRCISYVNSLVYF